MHPSWTILEEPGRTERSAFVIVNITDLLALVVVGLNKLSWPSTAYTDRHSHQTALKKLDYSIHDLEMMWKGAAMAAFTVLSQHLPQEAQKKHTMDSAKT
jgi:hypothetical protein